jgi:hypothetical protein
VTSNLDGNVMRGGVVLTVGIVLVAMCRASSVGAQTQPSAPLAPAVTAAGGRPIPGPVYEIPDFTRAVERGTRTRTGRPGANYWVQHARYAIQAGLDVGTNRVSGSERVVYLNNSPDTLHRLAVYLRQNVFAAGNPRRRPVPITGGMTLSRVTVNGHVIGAAAGSGYTVDGTVMWIPLAAPLAPHDSATLAFAWSYAPPSPNDGRQGRDGHVEYFMGYWYPQVAVYDDVHGWVADPYLLEAEFYMDPADYDVRVTVPRGWTVGATGTLENAREVLSRDVRARLAEARQSGRVVHIVEPGVTPASAFVGRGATATWHFVATDVRDFAWGTSNAFVWDATRALVARDGTTPDTVDIHCFYRISKPAAAWAVGGARYTRDAIERLSAYLWPYPWPQMTSIEGILDDGGMEYPMATLISPWADTLSLAGDLMHETGHMWFPMQVGSNETRYPWMDEGFTQFDVAQAMRGLYGEPRAGGRPNDSEQGQRQLYVGTARAGDDMLLMWPGDLYPQELYFTMFYDKTAQVLAALRGVLGEEVFHRAYREYGRRWVGKHPYPYDFFNTISTASGRDLSWFWTTWFYEPWPLDQAITSVEAQGDSTAITMEDRGLAPMPAPIVVTRADGSVQRLEVPVDVWLTGARRHVVRVAGSPSVVKVEIDPAGLFPALHRDDEVWPK